MGLFSVNRFRIVAVNAAGPGEPSEPSRMVKAKPRNLAPTLDMSSMKDIKVKAGQSIRFKVPISGEPTPTSTWTVNGKPIPGTRVFVSLNCPIDSKCSKLFRGIQT